MPKLGLNVYARQADMSRVRAPHLSPSSMLNQRLQVDQRTMCGIVVIKKGCAESRDVPLLELGKPSLNDIGARFRGTQDYATRSGFVGGFPTFFHAGSGLTVVCGTVLLTAAAAERRDVTVSWGPN
jgi:hypothetical protein